MRLRPVGEYDWEKLRQTDEWREALRCLDKLQSKPELHLEG